MTIGTPTRAFAGTVIRRGRRAPLVVTSTGAGRPGRGRSCRRRQLSRRLNGPGPAGAATRDHQPRPAAGRGACPREVTGIDWSTSTCAVLQRMAAEHEAAGARVRPEEPLRFLALREPDMVPLPDQSVDIVTARSVRATCPSRRVCSPTSSGCCAPAACCSSRSGRCPASTVAQPVAVVDAPFQHHGWTTPRCRERPARPDRLRVSWPRPCSTSTGPARCDGRRPADRPRRRGALARKVELVTNAFHGRRQLQRRRISKLGIAAPACSPSSPAARSASADPAAAGVICDPASASKSRSCMARANRSVIPDT